MTSATGRTSSDSVNLGSNPGSPATTNADVSGVSHVPAGAEKSEQPEQTAHTGRTETGTALPHDWVPSTLGHGETMCRRCFVTNREAAVLGISNACDVPPPAPKAANENVHEWPQDEIDEQAFTDEDDEEDVGVDCGRWSNGRLTPYCSKAGSEECDWDCPIGLPRAGCSP